MSKLHHQIDRVRGGGSGSAVCGRTLSTAADGHSRPPRSDTLDCRGRTLSTAADGHSRPPRTDALDRRALPAEASTGL